MAEIIVFTNYILAPTIEQKLYTHNQHLFFDVAHRNLIAVGKGFESIARYKTVMLGHIHLQLLLHMSHWHDNNNFISNISFPSTNFTYHYQICQPCTVPTKVFFNVVLHHKYAVGT